MSIVSFEFLFFVAATLLLYFVVPKKLQWVILLIANFVFYISISTKLVIFIVFTIITTYLGALCLQYRENVFSSTVSKEGELIDQNRVQNKLYADKIKICAVVLVSNFCVWVVLKYSDFALEIINEIIRLFGSEYQFQPLSLILPIGISFYTFQAAGYLIDVYRKKYEAETNIFKFALFLSFFPHIIQGPFSRFDDLGKTLFRVHAFSYDRLCEGCRRILWGYFKKLIIADKIGISVNEIFANWGGLRPHIYVCRSSILWHTDIR